MKIAALQLYIVKGDKEKNLQKAEQLISNQSVDLVVLPELFSTGYFFVYREEILKIAEKIPNGPTTLKLCEIAKSNHCYIVATIAEVENNKLFITATVTGPEGYLGKQRKRHLTKDEVNFYERGSNSEIFNINGCKVGVIVCFDGWFPESCRELTLKGAQIICHSALIMNPKSLEIMKIRALENKSYVIVSNSFHSEDVNGDKWTFRGESRIIDYQGNILADAGKEEKIIICEIDENLPAIKKLDDCEDLISEIRIHNYL